MNTTAKGNTFENKIYNCFLIFRLILNTKLFQYTNNKNYDRTRYIQPTRWW